MAETTEVKVPETTPPTTIASSIEAAEVELNKETKETKEEVKEPVVKEDVKEEKVEVDEMSAEDQIQAKQLFQALKDPEKAAIVIKFLAEQNGYNKIETKQEVKEAKDEVVESLKKSLGPDFDFLADKLAPAIKEILDAKLKESNQDIRATFEQAEETRLKGQADTAMSKIAQEFFQADAIPDDILSDMNKMMDRINPTKDMSVPEYIEEVFYSVVGRKGLTKNTKTKEDTIKKNRDDVPSRLTSRGTKEPETPESSKKMSLNEAIDAAAELLNKE
jgi:hypothetical protein